MFEFDPETRTMVEIPRFPGLSNIPRDWEIIKSFLDQYYLTSNWIYCDQVWGVLDQETGTWTGAVGMVRNSTILSRPISKTQIQSSTDNP